MIKFVIHRFDAVDSTNEVLKKMDSGEGTVVAAKAQTGGYGRNGRSFSSPIGGLYFSISLKAESINEKLFIPIKAAVAVEAALSSYIACGIKWPNDIISENKKICGILAESSGKNVVLGIGVNINTPQAYFNENHLPYAASINALTGKKINEDEVLNSILLEMGKEESKDKIIDIYRKNCITLGKDIRVIQGNNEYCAKALDVNENGELIVKKDNRFLTVNSGEVSIRGSGYI